jgi:carbamoyl-phosphate synthase large subunit
MTSAANVLITCGGKWVGAVLQFKAALRSLRMSKARVFVADRAAATPAGHFADGAFLVPGIDEPDYIDRLVELCGEHGVGVLVPLIDIDLLRLAPHGGRFARAGVKLVCPPPDLVELCFDKAAFRRFAEAVGIPMPAAFAAAELEAAPFPLFYKRARGFGSIGSGVCKSPAEARELRQERPDLVFEEYIHAPEVSVDAYIARNGSCVVRVPRMRDKVIGGEAVLSHTIRWPEICRTADAVIARLAQRGLRGPLNLQMFATEPPCVIEVNTRLGSASVLSNAATGGRLYQSLLIEARGLTAAGDPDDYEEGLHLYRFLGDVFYDGNQALKSFPAA